MDELMGAILSGRARAFAVPMHGGGNGGEGHDHDDDDDRPEVYGQQCLTAHNMKHLLDGIADLRSGVTCSNPYQVEITKAFLQSMFSNPLAYHQMIAFAIASNVGSEIVQWPATVLETVELSAIATFLELRLLDRLGLVLQLPTRPWRVDSEGKFPQVAMGIKGRPAPCHKGQSVTKSWLFRFALGFAQLFRDIKVEPEKIVGLSIRIASAPLPSGPTGDNAQPTLGVQLQLLTPLSEPTS